MGGSVPRLLAEFPLRGLLRRLAGQDTTSRDLPAKIPSDMPVLPYENHPIIRKEWKDAHTGPQGHDRVELLSPVRKLESILSHFDVGAPVQCPRFTPSPRAQLAHAPSLVHTRTVSGIYPVPIPTLSAPRGLPGGGELTLTSRPGAIN